MNHTYYLTIAQGFCLPVSVFLQCLKPQRIWGLWFGNHKDMWWAEVATEVFCFPGFTTELLVFQVNYHYLRSICPKAEGGLDAATHIGSDKGLTSMILLCHFVHAVSTTQMVAPSLLPCLCTCLLRPFSHFWKVVQAFALSLNVFQWWDYELVLLTV